MLKIDEGQQIMVATESDEYILVKKVDLEEWMQQSMDLPEWATGLKWLEKQTGLSKSVLPEKLLYPYREELEELEECVDYPNVKGERWRFNIKPMKYWLRTNFSKVNK